MTSVPSVPHAPHHAAKPVVHDDPDAPWLDGYQAFFDEEIDPLIDGLELERQNARTVAKKRAAWGFPLLILAVIAGVILFPNAIEQVLFGGFIAAILFYRFVRSAFKSYKSDVKGTVISKLCNFFGFDYTAVPAVNPAPAFLEVKLVPIYDGDRSKCEDQLTGLYEGVKVQVTDLHLRREQQTGRDRNVTTVFKGPAFQFSFPKRFNGTTIVQRDASALGNWFTNAFSSYDRIRLEDPVFEKQFEVYGDDQVEARYLLTPAFMTHLLDLTEILGTKTQVAFSNENLFIAVNNWQDRFKVPTWGNNDILRDHTKDFVDQVSIIFKIIHTLNLTSKTRL